MSTANHVSAVEQFCGPWLLADGRVRSIVANLRNVPAGAFAQTAPPRTTITATRGGVRIGRVDLVGILSKHGSPQGLDGMADARNTLRTMRDAATVDGVLLVIDSPGGTVAGTRDLAEEVAKAAAVKPVVAYVEDNGQASAYWIASQATEVYSNATAIVGGIGTYATLVDSSGQADRLGVKVHVVKAGSHKGVAVPGTKVTDAHLAEAQRLVDQINGQFIAAVAAGRGLAPDAVRKLADGRVYVGDEAAKVRLTNGVLPLDAAADRLVFLASLRKGKGTMSTTPVSRPVSSTTTTPAPAMNYDTIKASFQAAVDTEVAAGRTRQQAVAAAVRKHPALHAALCTADEAKVAAVRERRQFASDADRQAAIRQWNDAVELQKRPGTAAHSLALHRGLRGVTHQDAVRAAAKANPQLHAAFLDACQPR